VPREVDPRRTRKALRAVRKIAALDKPDPETGEIKSAESYSAWEKEFLGEVEQRLDKFGSAFHDLSKGRADEALSMLQGAKLKEIAAKAKGARKNKYGEDKDAAKAAKAKENGARGGFTTRKPLRAKRPMREASAPDEDADE
jgi:hypothetical protein